MREILDHFKYDGENTPIVIGSALCALEVRQPVPIPPSPPHPPPPSQGREPELGRESILKLLEHVDSWIPTPVRELDKPFLLPIEDVFSIAGRGTVTTGRVERGVMKKGEEAEIIGLKAKIKTTITGQSFRIRLQWTGLTVLTMMSKVLSHSVDLWSHSLDLWSHSLDLWSHSVDLWSHSLDLWSHSVDLWSHSVDLWSHSLDLWSHSVDLWRCIMSKVL